jgi:carbonic anhydrase/acetyltransferase-like protein (isoleucine patch superfamily)
MIQRNHAGDKPHVHPSAYVHPSAVIIGNVRIGEKVFVGPNAVIRADEPCPEGKVEAIVIESEVNIQDGVIIHALGGSPVFIGRGASLAHGAVVHGPCDVGEGCFIGFKSVVFNSTLKHGVVVLHQSLVEGVTIEAGKHVPSMTAVRNQEEVEVLDEAPAELAAFAGKVRQTNVFLAEVY